MLSVVMQGAIMLDVLVLSVVMLDVFAPIFIILAGVLLCLRHNAGFHSAKCHYAECRSAGRRGATAGPIFRDLNPSRFSNLPWELDSSRWKGQGILTKGKGSVRLTSLYHRQLT